MGLDKVDLNDIIQTDILLRKELEAKASTTTAFKKQQTMGGRNSPLGMVKLPPRVKDKLSSENVVRGALELILGNLNVCIEQFEALKSTKLVVKDQILQTQDKQLTVGVSNADNDKIENDEAKDG